MVSVTALLPAQGSTLGYVHLINKAIHMRQDDEETTVKCILRALQAMTSLPWTGRVKANPGGVGEVVLTPRQGLLGPGPEAGVMDMGSLADNHLAVVLSDPCQRFTGTLENPRDCVRTHRNELPLEGFSCMAVSARESGVTPYGGARWATRPIVPTALIARLML